jgi:O-antigen/teichoic acid export membrane protein
LLNKKIATNTFYLFIRTGFIVASQLVTLRIILNSFGQDLFGVYTVLYGVVTIGNIIPSSLVSTSQRYLSFSLGKNDSLNKKKSLFSSQLVLFAIGALISLVLFESIGQWFVSQKLGFPIEYGDQVSSFFRLTELAILLNILSSPFMGLLIAHENLKTYASLSYTEPFLKLVSALVVSHLSKSNLLTNYGVGLLTSSSVATLTIVFVVCTTYEEAIPSLNLIRIRFFKYISSFALWTLFGQISATSRIQFITVLIYQFFVPAVAASRGLSLTISTQINIFADNLNASLYGPIIKSYSQNKMTEMFQAIYTGSRLTFLLNSMLSLPLIYNADKILYLWLGKLTPFVSILTQLGLWESLLVSLSFPLMTAARAPGKVAEYEVKLGLIQISIPFITYFIFKLGYPVYSCHLVSLTATLVMTVSRLLFLKEIMLFNIKSYLLEAVSPCLKFVLITSILMLFVKQSFRDHIFLSVVTSFMISFFTGYFCVLNKNEKKTVKGLVKSKLLMLLAS